MENSEHKIRCSCGMVYDMRNLEEVIVHLHNEKLNEYIVTEYGIVRKIGESVEFTPEGTRIDLN